MPNEAVKQLSMADIKELVKKRLYALDEEYVAISQQPQQYWTESKDEHFWGVDLGDNLFLICNTVIEYLGGPRSVCGLVGYHNNRVMDHEKA